MPKPKKDLDDLAVETFTKPELEAQQEKIKKLPQQVGDNGLEFTRRRLLGRDDADDVFKPKPRIDADPKDERKARIDYYLYLKDRQARGELLDIDEQTWYDGAKAALGVADLPKEDDGLTKYDKMFMQAIQSGRNVLPNYPASRFQKGLETSPLSPGGLAPPSLPLKTRSTTDQPLVSYTTPKKK